MKKRVIVLIILLLVNFSAFAGYKVLWLWNIPDPKVTWVRYKVNVDAEDDSVDWTYVPNSVDEPVYVSLDVEKDKTYKICVQDSFDGVWWSSSSYCEVDTSVLSLFDEQ